jgi:uncharacterized membrane protein
LLVVVFLNIEARRYRFFDFWRVRTHILETQFFGPILLGHGVDIASGWNQVLHLDYVRPRLHITYADALGRRLRKNYSWILGIQVAAYLGKLVIHPTAIESLSQLLRRAAIGPVPGAVVLLAGLAFHGSWVLLALLTRRAGRGSGLARSHPTEDRVLDLARQTA